MTFVSVRDEDGNLHWVVAFEDWDLNYVALGCAECGPQERDDGKCEYILEAERMGPY